MTIHDKLQNETKRPDTNTKAREEEPFVTGRDDNLKGGERRWSFRDTGLFAAPIGRGLGSEYLSSIISNLTEIYKEANPAVEITIIPLDRQNTPALMYSCVLVCLRYKDNPKDVAYHILIAEATGDKIPPLFENINNTQIEVTRLASDAFEGKLIYEATGKVKQAFPGATLYLADGCVIPKSFNPSDREKMHRLAFNAGWACSTELTVHRSGFKDINLKDVVMDSTLSCNLSFTRSQIENAVGEPTRSDVMIGFNSLTQNSRDKSVNSGDRESKIFELSGFVDLVWMPVATAGAMNNPYVMQQRASKQMYAARFVITDISSNFSLTPAAVLLSIVTSRALSSDNNWIQSFRPVPSVGTDIDMHDIGALNVEANLYDEQGSYGTPIDTKTESFKLENLGQLVSALIQPGLIISLDVPECGPQSWYLSMFSAASAGNNRARDMIIQAANRLTDGNFTRHFDPERTPIFVDPNNRVHLGYWYNKAGVKRDIRDFDYLAVANIYGRRDPVMIKDWSDTFTRVRDYPLIQRLAARKKIIDGLSGETAEFTGFAHRVTFSNSFLEALDMACADSGLVSRISTPLSGADFQAQRGTASFLTNALMQPGSSFMTREVGYGVNVPYSWNIGQSRWTY